MGELDAEVLDGDDQSVVALEQQPLTVTGASESHLQQYDPSEDIRQDANPSAFGQAGNRKRQTLPDTERMEVEEEHDVEPEFGDSPFHGFPNNGMEELAARIEEVRVVLFA